MGAAQDVRGEHGEGARRLGRQFPQDTSHLIEQRSGGLRRTGETPHKAVFAYPADPFLEGRTLSGEPGERSVSLRPGLTLTPADLFERDDGPGERRHGHRQALGADA